MLQTSIHIAISHLIGVALLTMLPLSTLAECNNNNPTAFCNPLGNVTLYQFLYDILNAVVFIVFPFIVLMIVYTGFLFVAAQGNAEKLTKARSSLVWTVVGALVVLGAKALAMAIEATVADITV